MQPVQGWGLCRQGVNTGYAQGTPTRFHIRAKGREAALVRHAESEQGNPVRPQ